MTDITTEVLSTYQQAIQAEREALQAMEDARAVYRKSRTCQDKGTWIYRSEEWLAATQERARLELLKEGKVK